MAIYILDNDPVKIAQALDDKSLDRMIKDIAQVICNVHYMQLVSNNCMDKNNYEKIPLISSDYLECKWSQWARECKANYLYLVGLLYELLMESRTRSVNYKGKYYKILCWARENVPDLPVNQVWVFGNNEHPCSDITPFPLVMPKRYIINAETTNPEKWGHVENYAYAYRNYYQAKLNQRQCMKHDGCIYAQQNCCLRTKPYWSKREKPEWLAL